MRLRPKLTYANVVATLALFFALTGGVVYASGKLKIRSGDIASRAVKTSKIADGAVVRRKLAYDAVGSPQIENGSIELADLKNPVGFVASPSGGSLPIANEADVDYPLDHATWVQMPGEFDVIFGQIDATLQAAQAGSDCHVEVRLASNGRQAGGAWLQTGSSTPEKVKTGLGGEPSINFDSANRQELEMKLSSDGCAPGSSIDLTRIRVLGIS